MIKRFSKKQGSKQGVILLTVVFILAMAVIFISACMVMTQATRNRLYWKAEQSQARLTVTSAAEAFYQALEVGDFQEEQLKSLAKKGAKNIYMTATDASGKYLPGMSLADNNCTLLSLKAKDADCSEIYAYLVTTIDGESERVKVTFKVKKKTKVNGLFGNPVDYNGTVGQLNFEQLGYVIGGGSKSDNFLVVRKGCNDADSSSSIYSDIVFVSGSVSSLRAELQAGSDVVLLESAKWGIGDDEPKPKAGTGATPNYFFVSSGSASAALDKNMQYGNFQTTGSIVFVNRDINKSLSGSGSNPVYSFDLSGNWTTSTTYNSGSNTLNKPEEAVLTSAYNAAYEYAAEDFANQIGTFPTTEEAFKQLKLGDDPLPTEAPDDGFKAMELSDFVTAYGNTDASGGKIVGNTDADPTTIEQQYIKITTGGDIGKSDYSGDRYVFLFDGSTDYVIYFEGSEYNLYKCTFAVLNPSVDHNQLIVLEKGTDLCISTKGANGKIGGSGFLSVPRTDKSNAVSNYLTYIYGTNIAAENASDSNTEMKPTASVSTYYDSDVKPTFYVIGAGDNQVTFGAGSYFEGYMGLFNPKTSSSTSGITCCKAGGNQFVYGRLMFDGWNSGGDAGRLYMPYCPGPNNGNNKPPIELYKFGYDVISVDYYYTE